MTYQVPEIELLANVFIGKLKVSFNFFFQINCISEDFQSMYFSALYFEKKTAIALVQNFSYQTLPTSNEEDTKKTALGLRAPESFVFL